MKDLIDLGLFKPSASQARGGAREEQELAQPMGGLLEASTIKRTRETIVSGGQ
jgi:hypothetical protein